MVAIGLVVAAVLICSVPALMGFPTWVVDAIVVLEGSGVVVGSGDAGCCVAVVIVVLLLLLLQSWLLPLLCLLVAVGCWLLVVGRSRLVAACWCGVFVCRLLARWLAVRCGWCVVSWMLVFGCWLNEGFLQFNCEFD